MQFGAISRTKERTFFFLHAFKYWKFLKHKSFSFKKENQGPWCTQPWEGNYNSFSQHWIANNWHWILSQKHFSLIEQTMLWSERALGSLRIESCWPYWKKGIEATCVCVPTGIGGGGARSRSFQRQTLSTGTTLHYNLVLPWSCLSGRHACALILDLHVENTSIQGANKECEGGERLQASEHPNNYVPDMNPTLKEAKPYDWLFVKRAVMKILCAVACRAVKLLSMMI